MSYGQDRGSFRIQNQPPQWNGMMLTYIAGEEPWNEFNHGATHLSNQHMSSMQSPAFQMYRNPALSDYGTNPPPTLPSDSGYASQSRHPPPDSLCEDGVLDPELQVIDSQFDQFGIVKNPVPRFPDLGQPNIPAAVTPSEANPPWFCQECNKFFQSKATLKKHKQRHLRHFTCPDPACVGRDGFGTWHDLVRHQRGVHKQTSAPGKSYKCTLGDCREKHKPWPRADNFRSHLKGVHGISPLNINNEYLERFLIRPPPPPPQYVLKAVGSMGLDPSESSVSTVRGGDEQDGLKAELEELREEEEILPSKDISSDRHAPLYQRLEAANLFGQTSTILEPGDNHLAHRIGICSQTSGFANSPNSSMLAVASHPALKSEPEICASSLDRPDDTDEADRTSLACFAQITTPDTDSQGYCDYSRQPGGTVDDIAAYSINSPQGSAGTSALDAKIQGFPTETSSSPLQSDKDFMQMLDQVPEHIIQSYMMKRKLENVNMEIEKSHDDGESISRPKQDHKCPQCHKPFTRKCELNKHMKRHDRPYGCTFRGCKKKFGSKSDWRRHENSQHFQLEMWSCNQCSKAYHRREVFKRHLEEDHGLHGEGELSNRLESCRVDRHSNTKFWCGFCERIIPVNMKPGFWNERYDHIEDHFAGRNGRQAQDISEWKWAHGQLPEAGSKASQAEEDAAKPSLSYQPTGILKDTKKSLPGPSSTEKKRQRSIVETPVAQGAREQKRRRRGL